MAKRIKTVDGPDGFSWTYYPGLGVIEFAIPRQMIEDCSHSGACDEEVNYWKRRLGESLDKLPRGSVRKGLISYGAWTESQIKDWGDCASRVLWLMACSAKENGENIVSFECY
jgi:hypothetical protein